MNWEGKSPEEIEVLLRAALETAQLDYESARERRRMAAGFGSDAGLAPPDSICAGQMAIRADDAILRALDRYRQVLAWFTQFALTGRPPQDFEP